MTRNARDAWKAWNVKAFVVARHAQLLAIVGVVLTSLTRHAIGLEPVWHFTRLAVLTHTERSCTALTALDTGRVQRVWRHAMEAAQAFASVQAVQRVTWNELARIGKVGQP